MIVMIICIINITIIVIIDSQYIYLIIHAYR